MYVCEFASVCYNNVMIKINWFWEACTFFHFYSPLPLLSRLVHTIRHIISRYIAFAHCIALHCIALHCIASYCFSFSSYSSICILPFYFLQPWYDMIHLFLLINLMLSKTKASQSNSRLINTQMRWGRKALFSSLVDCGKKFWIRLFCKRKV